MPRAHIVGGGLFGSIIGDALNDIGWDTDIFDADRPDPGSSPAACLMKPSWFSHMGRENSEEALELLDRLYGVEDVMFEVGPVHPTVKWVDPSKILRSERLTPTTVHGVDPEINRVICPLEPVAVDLVVIAAGIWTNDVLGPVHHVEGLKSQAGCAFLLPEIGIDMPFIHPWAPYKQIVAFNRGDGLWISDGTALKPESLTEERVEQSWDRCRHALMARGVFYEADDAGEIKRLWGNRPYVPKRDGEPCYLEWITPKMVVATGGAKNGTIAAAWAANQIVNGVL